MTPAPGTCIHANCATSRSAAAVANAHTRHPVRRHVAPAWISVSLLASVLFSRTCCEAFESPEARIQRAVEQYALAMECENRAERLSRFADAEQLFQQIIVGDEEHRPVANAALYVNLGNAALQAEHVGQAIVAYRRALNLAPQHPQARQNLAYARSLLPDWARFDNTHSLVDSLFFWRGLLTSGQIRMAGAFCFLLAAALVAWGIARKAPLGRNLALLPLVAWIVISISLLLSADPSELHQAVVVTEATVYTADSENSPPRLAKPLPDGAELKLLQQRDRWSELQLPDGRTGWVLSSALKTIESPS